jgi:hypothetical protein
MGAARIATLSIMPNMPQKNGRRRRGKICTRMVKNPPMIPAKPAPVTALPTTNMGDVVAVEQSKEPTRKIAWASKNIRLIENSLYSLPKTN